MKKAFRYLFYAIIALIICLLGVIVYISNAFPKVDPAPKMEVEISPEKVERGKYLAYHVMMCADCHSERDFSKFSGPPTRGTEFVGGDIFDQTMGFPGRFISSNITPSGIGHWTDGELYRLITTGVKNDGEPIFPVMPYHNFGKMDPEDIKAVIAFLRTLDPVDATHEKSKADFPFNLILRTLPTNAEPSQRPEKSDKIAYGKYMFNAAACGDCHTKFEKGKFTGPLAGGGREFAFPDGSVLRSANLTKHETGISHYSRESFIQRFKMYSDTTFILHDVQPGEFQTIMPWAMYAGMEEDDIGAIYDYLITLDPCDNPVVKYSTASK